MTENLTHLNFTLAVDGTVPLDGMPAYGYGDEVTATVRGRITRSTVRQLWNGGTESSITLTVTGATIDDGRTVPGVVFDGPQDAASAPSQAEKRPAPAADPQKSLQALRRALKVVPWLLAVWAVCLGVAVVGLVGDVVTTHRQMTRCEAQFRSQFVAEPDGRNVWTSPACAGLDTDDLVTVHGRTVIDYQRDAERARTAAEAKG